MRLGKYVQSLTKSELEEVVSELNLTEEEDDIVRLMARGKSNTQIADRCCISLATLGIRISNINTKLQKITERGMN